LEPLGLNEINLLVVAGLDPAIQQRGIASL
jgi:hypothetical protein